MTEEDTNQESLEERTNNGFIKIHRNIAIGNTITGIGMGIANAISPDFPLDLQLSVLSGYNVIILPESKSLVKRLGEIATYTAYAFVVKHASNEVIQYGLSLIDRF